MSIIQIREGSQNTIFVIAVIKTDQDREDRIRTVAWTVDSSDAFRIVSDDIGQISDAGHYDLAVIEELAEGIYGIAMRQWFFQWNDKEEKYFPIDKPKRYNSFGRVSM